MQGLTQLTIPRFSPAGMTAEEPPEQWLWEVTIRVLAMRRTWVGRFMAHDSSEASRRALADARNRWKGHTFAVLSVSQVRP